jgi:hypothetical protein
MKPQCFVICPIGKPNTPLRERSDRIFAELIEPVVSANGFEPVRADMISEPGMISSQVIKHVADDHLAIADLTGANANVFYELAIRHATRRPCVCIFENGEIIPFDIAAYRAMPIISSSVDSLRAAQSGLAAMVNASLKSGTADSPIVPALGEWLLCVPTAAVPRHIIESIILSYLHLSFTMGQRKHLPDDQRCEEARLLLGRLETQLHIVTDELRMPAPNTFRDLEEHRWKAGRGEP